MCRDRPRGRHACDARRCSHAQSSDGVFKRSGAEDQREQSDRPLRLKCEVREEAVIAERDGEPVRQNIPRNSAT